MKLLLTISFLLTLLTSFSQTYNYVCCQDSIDICKSGLQTDSHKDDDDDEHLPIKLISFTINDNKLCWVTSTEENNEKFIIETSIDGINWDYLYQCKGAGTSNNVLRYTYIDTNSYTGIVYYRLKQVDYNGDFSYSNIIYNNRKFSNQIIEYIDFNQMLQGNEVKLLKPEIGVVYIKIIDGVYDSKILIIKQN